MRKRLWSILLVLCMVLSLLPFGAMAASSAQYLKYYLESEGEAAICCDYDNRSKLSGVLTIPSKIDGLPVTSIGEAGFAECTNLTEVIIPEGVTTLSHMAFYGCTKLKRVSLPSTLKYIGPEAFRFCEQLEQITIPDGVEEIDFGAFYGCKKLKNIRLPNSVKYIASTAFTETGYWENENNWQNGLLYIDHALVDARNTITKAEIKQGTSVLASSVFSKCASLTSAVIPEGVKEIPGAAFYNCTSLSSVTIPVSVISIGEGAFYECQGLTDVYYSGTRAQWDKIKIGDENDRLTTLTEKIHYESSGPDGAESTPAPTATPTFTVPNKKITLDEKQDVVMLKATLPYSDAAYLRSCMEKVDVVTADTMMKTAQKIVVAEDGKSAELIFTLDPYKAKSAQYNIWWDSDRLAGETVFVYGKEAQLDEKQIRKWEKSDQWSFTNTKGGKNDFDKESHGYFITRDKYDLLLSNLSPFDANIIDYKPANTEKNTPPRVRYNVDGNRSMYIPWDGSCKGMSVTAVLLYNGVLNLEEDFAQPKGVSVSQVEINDSIRSLINFYHFQQKLTAWQNADDRFGENTAAQKLNLIERMIKTHGPVVLSYQWIDYADNKTESIAHAVVAYAVQSGPFENVKSDGKTYTYQKKLCIYDCAHPNSDQYDLYYSAEGRTGLWCIPARNILSEELITVDSEGKALHLQRYNNGEIINATNDIELLNAVSLKDGSISSRVVNATLNSARMYALSDDTYTIKTKDGTVAMDGIRYVKTGMNSENVTVSMIENYCEDGTSEPSQVTVFLPEKDSYTVSSDNLLSYGFADNNKAAFVNAGASGDIVFKPSCETSISADQKTEISVTAFNNESKAAWDSFTITAENADDLTVEPNDIVVKVSGDLEKAEIEITKDGKTTKEKLDTKDESISFTVLDGRVIPVDPSPTNTPAPSAQPTTAPTVEPSPEPSSKPVSTKFVDVADGTYYADAVRWAVEHDPQITTGMDSTHFAPNRECTRAQMVTFLWRAAGEPKPESTKNPFTDVKKGAYYYDAVLWAVEQGITTGTGKTTFSPDATVTRAQTVTFLWRMEGEPAVKTKNPFTDVKSGQYYTNAILWAVKNNITNGLTATTFGPANPCTRAQIVTFLWRAMA